MTAEPVLLRELLDAQREMIEVVIGRMPEEQRRFFIALEKSEPDWSWALPKRPAFLRSSSERKISAN
jgi:hypothetical protein